MDEVKKLSIANFNITYGPENEDQEDKDRKAL